MKTGNGHNTTFALIVCRRNATRRRADGRIAATRVIERMWRHTGSLNRTGTKQNERVRRGIFEFPRNSLLLLTVRITIVTSVQSILHERRRRRRRRFRGFRNSNECSGNGNAYTPEGGIRSWWKTVYAESEYFRNEVGSRFIRNVPRNSVCESVVF